MAHETIVADPRLWEKILMTVQVLMIHVTWWWLTRQRNGKAKRLAPVPGMTQSKDYTYVCCSRQGAGIPDFAGLPCLSGKGRGLHAWEMVRRALAILWPSGRTVSFFPQTPAEGRVDTDSRGAPCRIRQD